MGWEDARRSQDEESNIGIKSDNAHQQQVFLLE